jgi:lipopolysaccharide export LptBFGC system permease protein LptF
LRRLVLTVVLIFTAALAIFTSLDIARHGITITSALAAIVLVLFGVGIVGALLETPGK